MPSTSARNVTLYTARYDQSHSPIIRYLVKQGDAYGCFFRESHTLLNVMAMVAIGTEISSKEQMQKTLKTLSKQTRILFLAAGNGKTADILAKKHGFDTNATDSHPELFQKIEAQPNDQTYPIAAPFEKAIRHTQIKKWLNKKTKHKYTALTCCNMLIKRRESPKYPDLEDPHLIGPPGTWKKILNQMLGVSTKNPNGLKNRAAYIIPAMNNIEKTPFTAAQIAARAQRLYPNHRLIIFNTEPVEPHQPITDRNTVIAIIPKTQVKQLNRNGRITRTTCQIPA